LSCSQNQLTSLDVSNNIALTELNFPMNRITSLDVSHNTLLRDLHCGSNPFTSLDVSNNTALTSLNCSYNQLSTGALNDLYETLHSNPGRTSSGNKYVAISGNPGTNTCNRNIAEHKGWTFW